MKKLAAVALAVGALGLVGFGYGRGHCGMRDPANVERFVNSRIDDALDDLDATPDQRAKIDAIKAPLLKEGLAIMQESRAGRADLLAQLDSGQPDSAKLHALVDSRGDAYRAFAHKLVDAGIQVNQILTPEQRAKVQKKLKRHAEK
jgi:periplasmic protein CpxP/Spy